MGARLLEQPLGIDESYLAISQAAYNAHDVLPFSFQCDDAHCDVGPNYDR